jgi:pyruvate kinase
MKLQGPARAVAELRAAALDAADEFALELRSVEPSQRDSARNLIHYLGVRRHDVRELQDQLARLGLSSLGQMESHVLASLDAVADALAAMQGKATEPEADPLTFRAGDALLAGHAAAILGPAPKGRDTRIMVTMPTEAAESPALVHDLVEAGMDIMRINCAHDSPAVWERMVHNLRQAERETGRRCKVSFDLAGPKLRTGPVAPGPAVAKWRPARDALGGVVSPAHVRFTSGAPGDLATDAGIPVGGGLLGNARVGDAIVFVDARRKWRSLKVVAVDDRGCTCEAVNTGYVVPGTRLGLHRHGKPITYGEVGALPAVEQWITLHAGDTLELLLGDTPGQDAARDAQGRIVKPAFISCALPDVFRGARVGEPILFDDGRIRGVIREAHKNRLSIGITMVRGAAAKLRAEKGINLPESHLALPALTAKDVADLPFVVRHADMVALSFVQRVSDVDALLSQLAKLHAPHLGIVLKIETHAAFDRLPALLLAALRHPSVAVMVARGDLGVEVGFERLSEVQEEILWLCEAAHVPVIWATQVLESLAKGGIPSRAEVTDAAMGSRAECVMLNKGPYVRDALRFLVDVLHRMKEHQHKRSARLRRLRISERGRLARVQ